MKRLWTAVLALVLLGAGCSGKDDPGPNGPGPGPGDVPGGEEVRSEKLRVTNPNVPPAELEQLVAGGSDFALSLLAKVKQPDENLFFSPHSITSALAMTYAGARGNTETQMAQALRFRLPQGNLHPAQNALDLALQSRGQGAQGADGQGFRLNVANALWGQTGHHFETAFLDTLALNYGAGLRLLDFRQDPEAARGVINGWVSARTEDRIPELLPEGVVSSDTRLVLTNAIYFNAAWAEPFSASRTEPGTFHLRSGGTVQAQMMKGNPGGQVATGSDYELVSWPYDGGELSMVVLLPAAGQFDAVEARLDQPFLEAALAARTNAALELTFPKFQLDSDLSLGEPLEAMGMTDAFGAEADFSGMTGNKGLAITAVVHKAFVKVDEKGTEAAAATGVVVGETSVPVYRPITVDRPFLFFILDEQTKAVLFVGRVLDPS